MSHDIFLSYNRKDAEEATQVCTVLQNGDVQVWFDRNLVPGDDWQRQIQKVLDTVPIVVVLLGPNGEGPWQELEINVATSGWIRRRCLIVPVLLPSFQGTGEPRPFLREFAWLDLRGKTICTASLAPLITRVNPHLFNPSNISPLSHTVDYVSLGLHEILALATHRVIVSGHTLDKFVKSERVLTTIYDLLNRAKVTFIQLNPLSSYAKAHRPYHQFESVSSSDTQHDQALRLFTFMFNEFINDKQKSNLEVLFTHYMPRFRTVIIDDTALLYNYMYGFDVASRPDFVLHPDNDAQYPLFRHRVIQSTSKLINAAETVAFIRYNQLYTYWRKAKLSHWGSWSDDEREHHQMTYDFYVTNARDFDTVFGQDLEVEVESHLNALSGRTLVVGCGSGKEVFSIAKRGHDVCGVDFSPVAIELARQKHHAHFSDLHCRFHVGDFYDLAYLVDSKTDKFDNIVANAAFVHLFNRNDIDALLKAVWEKLSPGGHFLLRSLYKEKDGIAVLEEKHKQERWKEKRPFVYFSRSDLVERCTKAGFTVLNDTTEEIAKKAFHPDPGHMKVILEKGFKHISYSGVFWPTVLGLKPIDSQ